VGRYELLVVEFRLAAGKLGVLCFVRICFKNIVSNYLKAMSFQWSQAFVSQSKGRIDTLLAAQKVHESQVQLIYAKDLCLYPIHAFQFIWGFPFTVHGCHVVPSTPLWLGFP